MQIKHVELSIFENLLRLIKFLAEDLLINPKDYPGIKEGDIVEIYQPENDFPRLLLQVPQVLKEDLHGRARGNPIYFIFKSFYTDVCTISYRRY